MRAGQLDKRITIQKPTEGTATGYGDRPVMWLDVFEAWAESMPQRGREFFRAMQVVAAMTHLFRLRYRSDVTFTPNYRITLGSRTFAIAAVVDVDEAHKEWRVSCTEEVV